MEHSLAFVFPGQGSQHTGMGKELFDRFEEARAVFDACDARLGFALSDICFNGTEEELKQTANTQPAILAVSSAIHAVLRSRGVARPDMVAGHSLGEYSAIVAAGGLEPAEGAWIVRQRGQFMQDAVPSGVGSMAAILGPSLEEIHDICMTAAEGEVVSPANINAPGQIVIAGTKAAVERAMQIAKTRGVRRSLLLPVSAPFHCALMRPAEQNLVPVLEAAAFSELAIPLVTNVDATEVASATAVRNALTRQVVSPVRWVESVQLMISRGVRRFVEIGPGSVLTNLIKRIDPDVEVITINSADTLEAYLAGSGSKRGSNED